VLGTTSIIASHARLYFNRGSSETICYVKAEGLNPWWQLHQSRNPQQLNGCNISAYSVGRNFRTWEPRRVSFPDKIYSVHRQPRSTDKGDSIRSYLPGE